MKKVFLIFLLFFSIHSHSQTIEGSVFDENKKPIKDVSVYLDGTTIETSTDENGKYTLNLRAKINTSLVISLMGYETAIIVDPFENKHLITYLAPKVFQLNEVVIKKELFSRQQKLTVFREQFLGTSKAGKSCTISNENTIHLEYDYDNNILKASANAPLKITNYYLGYEIEFDLQEFNLKFSKKSIKSSDVTKSFFLGTTFYREIYKGEKIDKKREATFAGSQMNFFKNLSNNDWAKDKFLLYKRSTPANPALYFHISNEANLKKIVVTHNQLHNYTINKPKFSQTFNVLYKNRSQSTIVFLTDTFYIDEFGNNSNPRAFGFTGALGKERLGDMLPMSYSNQIKK